MFIISTSVKGAMAHLPHSSVLCMLLGLTAFAVSSYSIPTEKITFGPLIQAVNKENGLNTLKSFYSAESFGQVVKKFASDGEAGDHFGNSVALSGDTAVIGAQLDNVGGINKGSAYVFVRSGNTWIEQAKLTAPDGASGDQFGYSVAISGDTAVIGANLEGGKGSAYVFVRSGSSWSLQQKISAADGASGDLFGQSVSISGESLIAGAPGDDFPVLHGDQGSAYVFTRSGSVWSQQQKLSAGDGAAADVFGSSVSISGNTVVSGAPGDDFGLNLDQGSAYVFERSGTLWSQQQKVSAADGLLGDAFGTSVAISGETLIAGAELDDIGLSLDQGSAYVMTRSGSAWSLQQKLTATFGSLGDHFGGAVAINGDSAVVDHTPMILAW